MDMSAEDYVDDGLTAFAAYAFLATPIYRATTVLAPARPAGNVAGTAVVCCQGDSQL
jgi:hypothetical protein